MDRLDGRPRSAGLPSIDARAILATLVLRTQALSRNRNYGLFLAQSARAARSRAAALRHVVRQLTGAQGPALNISLDDVAEGLTTLRYTLPRIAMSRELALSSFELALLRVALSAAGARLLPARLRATSEDVREVEDARGPLAD
jgi:hypothetical protein